MNGMLTNAVRDMKTAKPIADNLMALTVKR